MFLLQQLQPLQHRISNSPTFLHNHSQLADNWTLISDSAVLVPNFDIVIPESGKCVRDQGMFEPTNLKGWQR